MEGRFLDNQQREAAIINEDNVLIIAGEQDQAKLPPLLQKFNIC